MSAPAPVVAHRRPTVTIALIALSWSTVLFFPRAGRARPGSSRALKRQIARWRAEARAAAAKQDYETAIARLRVIRAADPSAGVDKQLADYLAWSGKLEKAIDLYRSVLLADPDDDATRLALANTLSWTKDVAHHREALKLLDQHLEEHPKAEEPRLTRARLFGSLGEIDRAAADYRRHLARKPDDDQVKLQLARVLSWSRQKKHHRASVELLDGYLRRHPKKLKVRLLRARMRAALGREDEAIADYRAYLAKHPDDGATRLQMAATLSWSKDKDKQRAALAVYDSYLAKHPGDQAARLQRARVRSWTADYDGAVADYRTYLKAEGKAKDEPKVRLELARALGQSGHNAEAIELLHKLEQVDGLARQARLERAQLLLWSGRYDEAEPLFVELRGQVEDAAVKRRVELQLARLYAQTGRSDRAVSVLDSLLKRFPSDEDARSERARLRRRFRPRASATFGFYRDISGIQLVQSRVDGEYYVLRDLSVLAAAGMWRIENALEGLWTGRFNLGLSYQPHPMVTIEALAGPRVYQYFSTKLGAFARISLRPFSWLQSSVSYAYDDIYQDQYQPATVSAQIRGHAIVATATVRLPWEILLMGRLDGRILAPDNLGLLSSGTLQVPVYKILKAGYNVQFNHWKNNDPSYWSPQAYVAHMFFVRVVQGFPSIGLAYDIQAAVGTANERADRVPDQPYGLAIGASGGLVYRVSRFRLRIAGQFGQSVRERVRQISGGPSMKLQRQVKQVTSYWWMTTTASIGVRL